MLQEVGFFESVTDGATPPSAEFLNFCVAGREGIDHILIHTSY